MRRWSNAIPAVTLAVLITLGVPVQAADVTYTDDFEGGVNASGWVYGFPADTILEPAGGNPGGWLKGDYVDPFSTPKLRTTAGADTLFHGDYAAAGVISISVDAKHISNQFGLDIGGYGMTGALVLRDNDTGMAAVSALNEPAFGNPVDTWFSVTVPIDSQATSTPANWTDAAGGLDWPTLMQGVDEVELDWWDPDFITIGASYVVGADNMSITFVEQEEFCIPCEQCPAVFDPVVCPDGNTYGNACLALCEGEQVGCQPACDVCPEVFDPVFCPNGEAYTNDCFALCQGAQLECDPLDCAFCPEVFDPVVCDDGNFYVNGCFALCEGIQGPAECVSLEGCDVCPDVIDPVVCNDGNTYPNQCVAACEGQQGPGQCVREECAACPTVFDPVICPDGMVYSNSCFALCEGDQAECVAACDFCPEIFDPVLCPDGETYNNACFAVCEGGQTECLPLDCDVCPQVFDPVICLDGNFYTNECFAFCEGGQTEADCTELGCDVCPDVIDPVICSDGNTYDNLCLAVCQGQQNPDDCVAEADCDFCPTVFDPVLCADGNVYTNSCFAVCDGGQFDCVPVDGDDEVCLCHMPPGNPDNAHTICVGAGAVDAHLGHGDTLGPCEDGSDGWGVNFGKQGQSDENSMRARVGEVNLRN